MEAIEINCDTDCDELVVNQEDEEELDSAAQIERKQIAERNFLFNSSEVALLQLPREVLCYVLRWVVSSRLDMVSLARWSLVCQDFHCISQDPSLWHAMSQKVWGRAVIRKPFATWKEHFLFRPHLHFHGVYISKTSYIRAGNSSVSFSSKPYHCVEYYRILRFFPNGEVLMLTTPQEPREVVHKLENKNKAVQGLLLGKYALQEDQFQNYATMTACMKSYYIPKDPMRLQSNRSRRQNRHEPPKPVHEYQLEMKLTSTSSRRKFNKLIWVHHSCRTRYEGIDRENTSVFDLTKQYPALYFNRVQSFTDESQKPI